MENVKTTAAQEVSTVQKEAKNVAVISYLTIIGLIIAFAINKDKKFEFAAYHIRQSVGLVVTGLALAVIGLIPILGWIINIVGFFGLIYLWVIGLMNAINEKEKSVPFLGKKFEEWFKSL